MDVDKKYLFSTGMNDQCVFQWKIMVSEKFWELDHLDYEIAREDVFLAEVEPKDKYLSIIDELLPLRDEIVDIKQKIDETIEPEIYLELEKVIGRKAYNRRNNLLLTEDNQLVFSSGSIIVSLQIPPQGSSLDQNFQDSYFQEKFLEIDKENIFSISPEISTISICDDGKFLCAGTTQNNAKLLIWELTSKTFFKSMTLNDCCTVLIIRYAYDSRNIACVALTRTYTQCIYLIDSEQDKILAVVNNLYSVPFKIKDLDFLPNSKSEFITCGVQHMTLWSYKGGILNFKELPIQFLKTKPQMNSEMSDSQNDINSDDSILRITFLAIKFVLDFIITAGDDGAVSPAHQALRLERLHYCPQEGGRSKRPDHLSRHHFIHRRGHSVP
jgi:WD40 repeat protein